MSLIWYPKYGIVVPSGEEFFTVLTIYKSLLVCVTFNVHDILSMLEDVGNFEKLHFTFIKQPPVAEDTEESSLVMIILYWRCFFENSHLYARSKANTSFSTIPDDVQAFVAILVVSGYCPAPR